MSIQEKQLCLISILYVKNTNKECFIGINQSIYMYNQSINIYKAIGYKGYKAIGYKGYKAHARDPLSVF